MDQTITIKKKQKRKVKILFYFKENQRVSGLDSTDKAIMDLKLCRDKVKAYMKQLLEKEKTQREKAKEHLINKDRDRAKLCLNKSKMYKLQAQSSDGQLMTIEEQLHMIESTRNQNSAFKALEEGNKALKMLQEEVNIEKWEELADDMADIRDKNKELNDYFQQHGENMIEDDEQLDKELEILQAQEAQEVDKAFPELKDKKPVVENIEEKKNTEKQAVAA